MLTTRRLADGLVLLLCGLALAGAALAFRFALASQVGPAAQGLTSREAEQLALAFVQTHYPGRITETLTQRVTLEQVNGAPRCSLLEGELRQTFVTFGVSDFNPCDPATQLWAVNFHGLFDFGNGSFGHQAEVVFTAAGDFFRAGGGDQ